jgi:nucleoid DNA-binding protein
MKEAHEPRPRFIIPQWARRSPAHLNSGGRRPCAAIHPRTTESVKHGNCKEGRRQSRHEEDSPEGRSQNGCQLGQRAEAHQGNLNKTTLVAHLAQTSGVEPKNVKAVVAALEATILASIAKKGAGAFTWPGVLKVSATHVPAKKARKGIDPFTKVERVFAAKPASVKVKARFFKKVKDAAL